MPRLPVAFLIAVAAAALPLASAQPQSKPDEDRATADSLAAMLRAGRSVISESQPVINDPKPGPKGLDGDAVLARSVAAYKKTTGVDPTTIDKATRQGRLIAIEMAAIKAVV